MEDDAEGITLVDGDVDSKQSKDLRSTLARGPPEGRQGSQPKGRQGSDSKVARETPEGRRGSHPKGHRGSHPKGRQGGCVRVDDDVSSVVVDESK